MKGFLLGLLVAAIAFGGYLYWQRRTPPAPGPTIAAAPDAGASGKRRKRRSRGASRAARSGAGTAQAGPGGPAGAPAPEPEPEPVKLSAADLKIVGQGDDLSRPDVVRLDLGEEGSARELTEEEIDGRFKAEEEAILDCISRARPDAETYVPGKVTVKFRIQRAGTVRGVRVDAPAILQKGGLYGCIKGVVGRLRFPPAGSSQVVTYPFMLS